MECKNCNLPLRSDYSFCFNCGAKIIRNRLTLKNLWHDITERYFNIDNTFLKTFLHLFTKPEVVIGAFIKGTRKKYINPIGYYAIAVSLSGLLFFLIQDFFFDQLSMEWLAPGSGDQGKSTFETTIKYQSILSIVSIPIYALLSKIMFLRNKKLNFTEHIITNLYLFAQYSITSFPVLLLSLMLGFNYIIATYIGLLFYFIYTAYALKRIFILSAGRIIWKTILFIFLLLFLMLLISILFTLTLYLTGGLEALQSLKKPS